MKGVEVKAGDTFRGKQSGIYNDEIRTITHVGEEWILYELNGSENCLHKNTFEKSFELLPDFFEEGKTYTRTPPTGTKEVLVIESVRTHGTGEPVAFGRYEQHGKPDTLHWTTFGRWSWRNEGWAKV